MYHYLDSTQNMRAFIRRRRRKSEQIRMNKTSKSFDTPQYLYFKQIEYSPKPLQSIKLNGMEKEWEFRVFNPKMFLAILHYLIESTDL